MHSAQAARFRLVDGVPVQRQAHRLPNAFIMEGVLGILRAGKFEPPGTRQHGGQHQLGVVFDPLNELRTRGRHGALVPGHRVVMNRLLPGKVIKDGTIPTLLCRLKQPACVTIKSADFWRCVPADKAYYTVCLELIADQADKISGWLRRLLREFLHEKFVYIGCAGNLHLRVVNQHP